MYIYTFKKANINIYIYKHKYLSVSEDLVFLNLHL